MSECMEIGKPTVQILLSTYNGERFLQEQLDSFFALESFDKCCVLIRDDGSTDGTRDILKKYENTAQFRIVYGENIGITDSYMWLLRNSDPCCKYFAFSDQDDVWLPNKISTALESLERSSQEQPCMFASLSCIVDSNLNKIGTSVIPRRGVSYYNAMIQNVLPGHTQIINRSLLELVLEQGYNNIHVIDWWNYLVASAVGTVVFHAEPTVLHRQHESNAVGMKENVFDSFIRRIRYIAEGRGNAFSKQLQAFYTTYKNLLPSEYAEEAERFLCSLPNIGSRLRYILSCKAYRQGHHENLAFKFLYLIGKYKL